MKLRAPLHKWDVTPAEGREIQERLRGMVILEDKLPALSRVTGVDVGFEAGGSITRAALAVLRLPDLALETTAIARLPTSFPYVPGLLSFREVPAVLEALAQLDIDPQILLCDGQGIAHPRRFGIACHLGVLTGLPTIGVAKSRLIGAHRELPLQRGARVPLTHKDEVVGTVLRSRTGVRPLYVSPGHRVSQATAVDIVLRCLTRYRLPETTRQADRLASARR